jgi:putative ABC transport system permease protein
VADITADWRMALVAVGVSLAAGLVFGLAPALHARRIDLVGSLTEDGQAPVGGGLRSRTARARMVIMVAQVGVATVLLVGAGLLMRSFVALLDADRGFARPNLLTARLPMPDGSYTPQRRTATLERTLERLKAVPFVSSAAVSTHLPLSPMGAILGAFPVPGANGGTITAHAAIRVVSPDYFRALGTRLVAGRGFTDADTGAGQEVLIVNRTFARQYLRSPAVGTRLPATHGQREVIGIVEDIRYGSLSEPAQPEIYQAMRQQESGLDWSEPAILVRTSADPLRVVPFLRSIVREQDPALALESVMTMEDRVWTSLAKPRLYALLLGVFAGFAGLIAGVGLFGVLSYSVSQRAREIGVRTSLGATPRAIAGLVLRQALAVAIVGIAIGLATSAAVARYFERLIYGVSSYDTVTYLAVPAMLVAVALVACIVPAYRAASVDPVRVLR